jgi:hypothetical protein
LRACDRSWQITGCKVSDQDSNGKQFDHAHEERSLGFWCGMSRFFVFHYDSLATACQNTGAAAIAASKFDIRRFIRIQLDNCPCFAHCNCLAWITYLADLPIDLWSKHQLISTGKINMKLLYLFILTR